MANETKKLKVVLGFEDNASDGLKNVAKKTKSLKESLEEAAIPSAALSASLAFAVKSVLNASQLTETSLLGLSRVTEAVGEDQNKATLAAVSLSEDGLMSVQEAANALKNLLATGFSLPQSIELMNAFRDAAAFNRQGTLKFGEAIVGATIGLKNQNSILVDNVGITKNLSVMMKEAGLSVSDLMHITDDASIRQKLFNEIIEEASIFTGDAATLTETYSGQVSELETSIFNAKSTIGDELKPAMSGLLSTVNDLVIKTPDLIKFFTENEDALIVLAGAITGMLVPAFAAAVTALTPLIPFAVAGGVLFELFKWLNKFSVEWTGSTLFDQLNGFIRVLVENLNWLRDTIKEAIRDFNNFMGIKTQSTGVGGNFNDLNIGGGGGGGGTAGDFIARPGIGIQKFSSEDTVVGFKSGGPIAQSFASSPTINFYGGVSVRDERDIEDLAQRISSILDRQAELARLGVL